jgi:putative transposase
MSESVEPAGSEPLLADGVDIRELIDKARVGGVPLAGPDGLLSQIAKTVLETARNAELDEHLGYAKGDPAGRGSGNQRNGRSQKTVHTDVGSVRIDVPRDRNGEFEPQLVSKHARAVRGPNTLGLGRGVVEADVCFRW